MGRADENLRIGAAAFGALNHLFSNVPFPGDVDFMEARAFAGQQILRVVAVGAELDSVDVDGGHDRALFFIRVYMDVWTGSQPWQKPAHPHWRPLRATG